MPLPLTESDYYGRPPIPPPYSEESENCEPGQPPKLPPRPYIADSSPPPLPARLSTDKDLEGNTMFFPVESTSIFSSAISTKDPSQIFPKSVHPVPIPPNTISNGRPIPTNKFYGNMMLGDQTNPVWTHPYSIWLSRDFYFGMSISYTTSAQRVFSPNNPPQYYFSPTGIKSFTFSAEDFSSPNDMKLEFANINHLSINALLKKSDDQYIMFPLVQGMGFVTAAYFSLVPKLSSAVGIKSMTVLPSPRPGIQKYKLDLHNGVSWILYVTVPSGKSLSLVLKSENVILGDQKVHNCIFQIVADTNPAIDVAAGCFPVSCNLWGCTRSSLGTYKLIYETSGLSNGGKTLMYALPHHVKSFTPAMASKKINSFLDSTVYGKMTAYITKEFEMEVLIPKDLGFHPFSTIPGKEIPSYSSNVIAAIEEAASFEAQGDIDAESDLDSMYFSGKILAKYAWILFCSHYILKKENLAKTLVLKLKNALQKFVINQQKLPLKYDTTWGGIISSGSSSQDFGNSYYNDHHFHYAYHVITAAIIAKVDNDIGDGSWLAHNRDWVETLIRDYSNPSKADPYFPEFRSFDWFAGHSWAKGLFPSGDGKDQESSSEDVNAAYALKLWGSVAGNAAMESIGLLELGIMRISANEYFLYTDDNTTQPANFIPNKVSGIFFENKIDHTTYFGNKLIYIQMIHAIPITPASSFIRTPAFVKEEWEQKLSSISNEINDGWKGILMLNVALFDPRQSYEFFSSPTFASTYLDNGQSRTWSLAYSGAFI